MLKDKNEKHEFKKEKINQANPNESFKPMLIT
jgi:hypothetical protein